MAIHAINLMEPIIYVATQLQFSKILGRIASLILNVCGARDAEGSRLLGFHRMSLFLMQMLSPINGSSK